MNRIVGHFIFRCTVWFTWWGWICTWISCRLADLRPRSKNAPALYGSLSCCQIYTGAGAHLRACEGRSGSLTAEPASAKNTQQNQNDINEDLQGTQTSLSSYCIFLPAYLLRWWLRGPCRCWLTRRRLFLFLGIHILHCKFLRFQQTQNLCF